MRIALNTVLATIGEVFALTACTALYFIDLEKRDPKELIQTDDPDNDIPIVLIHGYMHNSSAWIFMRKQLNKAGFHNVYTINLGFPTFKSIPHYSEMLDQKIQKILKKSGSNKVRLIGHSMGGVIAAYYAVKVNKAVQVVDVITIGAPLQGSKVAFLGPGNGSKEINYKSPFSQDLVAHIKNSNANGGPHFFHLGSQSDLIIRPTSSSVMGDENAPNTYVFPIMGHVMFLYSPKVAEIIIKHFKK